MQHFDTLREYSREFHILIHVIAGIALLAVTQIIRP